MDKLIFLTNELQNPSLYCEMNLPFTFISFGFTQGKMYTHFRNTSTFITTDLNNPWGNEVVYGGLFLCKDFDFYSRILDAYHVCSMSTLYYNHKKDIHHRTKVQVTTISFDSINDLANLKYKETAQIEAETYMGNPFDPKIKQRVFDKKHSHRVVDGIDVKSFISLFREVNNG